MKILSIKLSNLASLSGEQYIDFNTEPLKSAGLIAITGRTGAGKSTILDALCLALYGEVPRFQYSTSSKIDDYSGKSQVTINDVRQILRRGTGHGFAEVEFIGLDGVQYRSTWTVRRARNSAKNDLVKAEYALQVVEDGRILANTRTEHKQLIPQLIGLTFAQFTRAVLLAQFEVGAFLKANDNERASLLEYLTNSKIFSLIGRLAYQKNKQYEAEYKLSQQKLQQFQYLDDEQRQQLEQQHQDSVSQLKSQQLELQRYQQQQRQQQQYQQLCTTLEQTQQQYQSCLAQADEIAEYQQQVQRYQDFSEIRHRVAQEQALTKDIQQYQQDYALSQQYYQDKYQYYQQLERDYQTAKQTWQQHQTEQQQQMPHIEQASALEQQRDYLRQQYKQQLQKIRDVEKNIKNIQQDIDKSHATQQNHQQQIAQYQTALAETADLAYFDENYRYYVDIWQQWQDVYQHYQQKITTIQSNKERHLVDITQIEQKIAEYQQQYGSLDDLSQRIQEYLKQRHQLQQQSIHLRTVIEPLMAYQQHQYALAQEQQQLIALATQQQQAQQQLDDAHQTYQQAEQKYADVVEILQQQRLLHSQSVQQLRQQLQENQPCMVCGSVEHPYITHQEMLSQQLDDLHQQQEQQAKQARETALQQWQQQQQNVARLDTQYQQCHDKMTQLQTQLQREEQELETHWQQWSSEQNANTLASLTWQNWQQQIDDVLKQFEQLRTDYSQQLAQAEEHYRRDNQVLSEYRQVNAQAEQWAEIKHIQQQYQQLEQKFVPHFTAQRQQAWQTDSASQLIVLQQQIQQRQHHQQALAEQQEQLKSLEYDIKHQQQQSQLMQKTLTALQSEQHAIEQQGLSLKQRIDRMMAQYAPADFNVKDVKDWKDKLYELVQLAQQNSENLYQQKQQLEQQLQQADVERTQQQTRLQHHQQQLQQANDDVETWLKTHSNFTVDDLISMLEIDSTTLRAELEQKIQDYYQSKNILQGQIQTLTEQKQQFILDDSLSLDELTQRLADIAQQLQQLEQQERQYHVQLEHDRQQREYYQQQANELEKTQADYYRWHKIYSVIGSQHGEKFQRIAQQYYLDILLEYANMQLQQLAPRYELQRIPHHLGLLIKDREMNDELRTVLSLSGGESFLVSLALALAIAHLASGSIQLNSLFIDEGFGSLDQQSLHIVMDTLERLQGQGRKVIVISHISEIHERIPVQIQVKPQGAGQSRIEVVG